MANRKRKMVLRCPVTEEERAMIMKKMELAHIMHIGAYLRKMAIDGLIIYTDLSVVKEYQKELSSIGRNINQIAKRLNSTDSIYKEDIKDLRERLDDIWRLQRTILLTLR
ncbi:MAG: plasmid mobilization relaxosome protein MobC [Clostridia bacterium]|nr:plasmid mobilization relaxosome protein MobC [Clostridia bacterium]